MGSIAVFDFFISKGDFRVVYLYNSFLKRPSNKDNVQTQFDFDIAREQKR